MEFLDVVGLRRSIRWFKPWEPVPRENIQRILEVARLTTCPGNLQPWRAIVVERDRLSPEDRETLLKAENWQGAHTQAPVWIYWYADATAAAPGAFQKGVHVLYDLGALPAAYGWSHEQIDASMAKGEPFPRGGPAIETIIPGLTPELSAWIAYAETCGALAVSCLAAVNEGLGTCLHMISTGLEIETVKKVLNAPAHYVPVWLQLVGYPAEEPEAGGQRPRFPFEDIFFDTKVGNPYPRDAKVVEDLKREGLIRAPMPKPGRFEELKHLSRMFGYPV